MNRPDSGLPVPGAGWSSVWLPVPLAVRLAVRPFPARTGGG